MKLGVRAGLILLSFAVATTFFAGCSNQDVATSVPVDDSHTTEVAINPQVPDVKDKFTKWVEASQSNQETADAAQELMDSMTKTGQNLYGIYDVYEKDGVNYIISGSQLVKISSDGKISAADRQFLRMPGSNQRVYLMDSETYQVTKEIYDTYTSIVDKAASISFEDRNESENYISTPSRMFRDIVINGMYQYGENTNVISPAEDILAEGCAFDLDELLAFFRDSGFVTDLERTTQDTSVIYTGKIHTPTAVEDFEIQISSPSFTPEGLTSQGNLSELGGSFLATHGDQEYELDAAIDGPTIYVREDVLASLFQVDLDECELEDGTPVLMMVTDVMDLPSDSVLIEDTGLLQPVTADTSNASTVDTSEITQTKEDIDAIISATNEQYVQKFMDQFDMTREEAEACVQKAIDGAEAKKAEIDKNRQEYLDQWKAESQRTYEEAMAKKEQWAQENYGVSYDEYKSMTLTERYQLSYERQQAAKG